MAGVNDITHLYRRAAFGLTAAEAAQREGRAFVNVVDELRPAARSLTTPHQIRYSGTQPLRVHDSS